MARVDPFTVEIVRNALDSVCEQMSSVIERTAYSTIIRDILDFSTALFDARGRIIAQSSRIPAHGSPVTLRTTLPHASLEERPTSPIRRSTWNMSGSGTWWIWKFCRVVMWPFFSGAYRSTTSPSTSICSGVTPPKGSLMRIIWRAGWRCRYVHAARLWHMVSPTTGGYKAAQTFRTGRSTAIFVRKYAGAWGWTRFLFLIAIAFPAALARELFRGNAGAVFAKYRGFLAGFRTELPTVPPLDV